MKSSQAREDVELVAVAKADPKRFGALYDKYALGVYNYFFPRIGRERERALDLTQETFLRAFEHLASFRSRGHSYLTYLLTVAHNLLVNEYRKRKEISLEAIMETGEIPDPASPPHESDHIDQLWRAIESLSLSEKDLLLLHYQKELSVREVAAIVGKSENAVKLSLSRTRKKLRTQTRLPEKKAPFAGLAHSREENLRLQHLRFRPRTPATK